MDSSEFWELFRDQARAYLRHQMVAEEFAVWLNKYILEEFDDPILSRVVDMSILLSDQIVEADGQDDESLRRYLSEQFLPTEQVHSLAENDPWLARIAAQTGRQTTTSVAGRLNREVPGLAYTRASTSSRTRSVPA